MKNKKICSLEGSEHCTSEVRAEYCRNLLQSYSVKNWWKMIQLGESPPSVGRLKPKNVRFLSFNACGLTSNVLELKKCMSENSIDIALVQETYLKANRPKACSIAGYVQLRTDRTYSSKGGTALYYRRSLHCGPINIPPLINMEATGCRLAMTIVHSS
ncbi:hypothetical protein EVAR_82474_1 [Eumeta japonica]|uniref:RNA-directed DNA polymerase from mobile element jockey n=1 Tax=Eumeta variegata TaxID=151549 RepID=A0A4C1X8E0_EUMVA|nr:hypothetical protein EVAR_82474_1 [Eumeta japonica]